MKRIGPLLLGCFTLLVAQSVEQKPPAAQPIPFNHKQHAAAGVKCLDCHVIRKPGFAAGIPGEATCMGCHATLKTDSPAIQKLAQAFKEKKPVAWVKIYRVPDYVWFSHDVHYREAKVDCASCHGPVAERELIVKEKPTSMASCQQCHESRGAPLECNTCHDVR
jgi:cytochrome c7-like protein/class III cytochrome C family protein